MPCAILVALIGTASSSHGQQTVALAVPVDEATYADFKALTDWIQASSVGSPVPEPIAHAGTAAMADIAAAAEGCVDAEHWLTTDTGARVRLTEGDILHVAAYLAASPGSLRPPVIVIQAGQGYATTLNRNDLAVPSGL